GRSHRLVTRSSSPPTTGLSYSTPRQRPARVLFRAYIYVFATAGLWSANGVIGKWHPPGPGSAPGHLPDKSHLQGRLVFYLSGSAFWGKSRRATTLPSASHSTSPVEVTRASTSMQNSSSQERSSQISSYRLPSPTNLNSVLDVPRLNSHCTP